MQFGSVRRQVTGGDRSSKVRKERPVISNILDLPEWIPIYYVKNNDKEYQCNICEDVIKTDVNSMEPLQHIKTKHKEIYNLHKDWKKVDQDPAIGFQIEFLQLNVKDPKPQPILVEQICEVTGEIMRVEQKPESKDFLLVPSKRKNKMSCEYGRKRSWVWKYFDKLTNIIYRCNLCTVVLSIKGCNTNNMNRHVRTRHPGVYKAEMENKHEDTTPMNISHNIVDYIDPLDLEWRKDDDCGQNKDDECAQNKEDAPEVMRQRRSWIWSYFKRVSSTLAQCKLCQRSICHGGNATGNMNRHLKMVHNKTAVPEKHNWIWKVFEKEAEQIACKICHFKCVKFQDPESSIKCILHHLKTEHGVVSSDQIITESEYEIENVE